MKKIKLQIIESILQSIEVKKQIVEDENVIIKIADVSSIIIKAYKNNNKILFCGNGGSAADAQHLSAELSGRFKIDRDPLDAEALHVNTSYVTAVANDYSYDEIYSRLIKAKGRKGDILIGLSTSGNSKNVVKAFKIAKEKDMITIYFTGARQNLLEGLSDVTIKVPSQDTANIQESHIMIGHIICDLVEKELFKGEK